MSSESSSKDSSTDSHPTSPHPGPVSKATVTPQGHNTEENADAPLNNDNQDNNRAGRSSIPRPAPPMPHSSSMIISADEPTVDNQDTFGPDDARAMSPRRSSAECDEMSDAARSSVREHARQAQLSLLEIAESIELVRHDHDRLERQNLALQDYIGGLTRSMSKNDIGAASGKSKK
ncbi:hypothetical protein MMC34_003242 [Xylographa carneopallida]|nr:hypothetical protein [Xylographa carneopallida]